MLYYRIHRLGESGIKSGDMVENSLMVAQHSSLLLIILSLRTQNVNHTPTGLNMTGGGAAGWRYRSESGSGWASRGPSCTLLVLARAMPC